MAKVIVRIKNGVAESIEDIPTDVSIEVRNYDIANVAEDQLSRDNDGTNLRTRECRNPGL
jgi:hypothetical protein